MGCFIQHLSLNVYSYLDFFLSDKHQRYYKLLGRKYVAQWLSLLHNFIQQNLNSGSAQV